MNTGELQKLPLFSDLSPEESSCLEQGEEILVQAGEIFFRPADEEMSCRPNSADPGACI